MPHERFFNYIMPRTD